MALPTTNDELPMAVMKIGVLALQGDFDAHRKRLEHWALKLCSSKSPSNSTRSMAW